MRTKTSSHPIDERGQVVGAMLAGLAAPTGRIAPDDEFSTLEELVARLEAENARLQRQVQIYRELCVAD